MKNKPTQSSVVLAHLLNKMPITGSLCYRLTKVKCGVGSLNLHVLLRLPISFGIILQSEWKTSDKGTYKVHQIDFKKTPKEAIKKAKNYLTKHEAKTL